MSRLHKLPLVVLLAIGACGQNDERENGGTREASATASVDSSGIVTTSEASPADVAALRQVRGKYDEVERKFPLPQMPNDVPRTRATRVLSTGEIVLEDGRTAILDGVTCPGAGAEYLGRWLTAPEASLVVVPTAPVPAGQAIPANIWVVDKLPGGEGRSFPADGGISSGWCSPRPTPTSTLNARYEALAKAFSAERESYAKSVR